MPFDGAISTSAGRGGTSDYISCLRCHRVFHGLLNAGTPHQARDAAVPESHRFPQAPTGGGCLGTLPGWGSGPPSPTIRSRGSHRGWVPRYYRSVGLVFNKKSRIDLKLCSYLNFLPHNSRRTTFPTLTQRPGAVICYVMGEGKRVVFVHRGAGSTIGCLLMALFRRPPVEGGRQTIFHVSVATGFSTVS